MRMNLEAGGLAKRMPWQPILAVGTILCEDDARAPHLVHVNPALA